MRGGRRAKQTNQKEGGSRKTLFKVDGRCRNGLQEELGCEKMENKRFGQTAQTSVLRETRGNVRRLVALKKEKK